jgi:hypothetical protein
VARKLARKGERRLVAIVETEVVQRVGHDDLGLRADEVVAASGAADVAGVDDRSVPEREQVGGSEQARQATCGL